MATYTIGAGLGRHGSGVTDKRNAQPNNATNPLSSTTFNATKDITAMDTALNGQTVNGVTYTAALLQQMTVNDKIYALRLLNDPTGI